MRPRYVVICCALLLALATLSACGGSGGGATGKATGIVDPRTLQPPATDTTGATDTTQDQTTTSEATSQMAGAAEASRLLAGIPQSGNSLGSANAPLVMYEFVDYQCPFCKEFSLNVFPTLVTDYVRTGKLRVKLMPLTFIGPESETAARAAAAAGAQARQFNFTEVFYANQGQENSGYVTDAFIDDIYGAIGVDQAAANRYRASPASKAQSADADRMAERYGVDSTPSFVVGPSGGRLRKLDVDASSPADLQAKLDGLLKAGG